MGEHTAAAEGVTRRDLLRRGAVLGGALAWSVPAVQTFGMQPAYAAATSYAVSYVAMVHDCGGSRYQVKWEVGGGWSAGGALPCSKDLQQAWPTDGSVPSAPPGVTLPEPTMTPIDGDKVKWTFDFSASGCTVVWSLNKCAQICELNSTYPAGTTSVTFDPCVAV